MKNLLVYSIEWDNPHHDLDFGASLPRTMYFVLNRNEENLTKESIAEKISKSWFGRHKPISFRFREATDEDLEMNCHKNFWPIIRELLVPESHWSGLQGSEAKTRLDELK